MDDTQAYLANLERIRLETYAKEEIEMFPSFNFRFAFVRTLEACGYSNKECFELYWQFIRPIRGY